MTDFCTVPEGTYVCRIAEVRPGLTRAGHERWSFRLVVTEGEYEGRQAAWDSIVFSPRGHARVRLVLKAFGFQGDIEAPDLTDPTARAQVTIRHASYVSGTPPYAEVTRCEVPFDGYAAP